MKKTIIFLILFYISSCVFSIAGNIEVAPGSKNVFDEYMQEIAVYKDSPIENLVIKTATFFLSKPYVASTLEIDGDEKLVVNLMEFDCTTFVENCIALSLMLKSNGLSLNEINPNFNEDVNDTPFNRYCAYLQLIRYREGKIDGYTSRLHYMIDWAYDASSKGLLTDVSSKLGGVKTRKQINFMSLHPQSYVKLANNNENISKIKETEKIINARNSYFVISKNNIDAKISQIKSGDIIIFATSFVGLDYSHVGIAYKTNGILKFIHASSKAQKVIIETKSLQDYCILVKSNTGISVLRLI